MAGMFHYRVCGVCSVNWVLTQSEIRHAGDVPVLCYKCKGSAQGSAQAVTCSISAAINQQNNSNGNIDESYRDSFQIVTGYAFSSPQHSNCHETDDSASLLDPTPLNGVVNRPNNPDDQNHIISNRSLESCEVQPIYRKYNELRTETATMINTVDPVKLSGIVDLCSEPRLSACSHEVTPADLYLASNDKDLSTFTKQIDTPSNADITFETRSRKNSECCNDIRTIINRDTLSNRIPYSLSPENNVVPVDTFHRSDIQHKSQQNSLSMNLDDYVKVDPQLFTFKIEQHNEQLKGDHVKHLDSNTMSARKPELFTDKRDAAVGNKSESMTVGMFSENGVCSMTIDRVASLTSNKLIDYLPQANMTVRCAETVIKTEQSEVNVIICDGSDGKSEQSELKMNIHDANQGRISENNEPVKDISALESNTADAPCFNKINLLQDDILDLILRPVSVSESTTKPCCHQCRACPKIFRYSTTLARHERTHTDKLPYANRLRNRKPVVVTESYSEGEDIEWEDGSFCPHCGGEYDTSSQLKRHITRVHNNTSAVTLSVGNIVKGAGNQIRSCMPSDKRSDWKSNLRYIVPKPAGHNVLVEAVDHSKSLPRLLPRPSIVIEGKKSAEVILQCLHCSAYFRDESDRLQHKCPVKSTGIDLHHRITDKSTMNSVYPSKVSERPRKTIHDNMDWHKLCPVCKTKYAAVVKLLRHAKEYVYQHTDNAQEAGKDNCLLIAPQSDTNIESVTTHPHIEINPINCQSNHDDSKCQNNTNVLAPLMYDINIADVRSSNQPSTTSINVHDSSMNSIGLGTGVVGNLKTEQQTANIEQASYKNIPRLQNCPQHTVASEAADIQTRELQKTVTDNIEYIKRCSVCRFKFEDVDLVSHMQAHADQKTCFAQKGRVECASGSVQSHRSQKPGIGKPGIGKRKTWYLIDHKNLVWKECCLMCKMRFATLAELQSHIKEHFPEQFLCGLCDDKLETELALNHHYYSKHRSKSRDELSCTQCSYKARYFQAFSYHMRNHTRERPFKCTQCDRTFKEVKTLRRHALLHSGLDYYLCPQCDMKFNRDEAELFKLHRESHADPRPFVCTQCDKSFLYPAALRHHIRGVHKTVTNSICKQCGKACMSEHILANHIRQAHTGKRAFICPQCGKSYTSTNGLHKHEKYHGNRTHACTQCESKFFRSTQLNRHIRIKHNKELPFSCGQCAKKFAVKLQLTVHMVTHTGIKDFACKKCDKKFSVPASVSRHMKEAHVGEERFKCPHCDMMLTQKTSLIRHVGLLHGNTCPYVCAECKRRFTDGTLLKQHLQCHAYYRISVM